MVDFVRRWGVLVIVAASAIAGPAVSQESSRPLAFTKSDQGGYAFDTGVLRGTLCPNGKPQGLVSVVYVPTGTRLDRGAGILSYYRVFTTNKRYGTAAWEWPGASTALQPDGAVRVSWPSAADRPFEMSALYRWKDPQTLDVETTVRAVENLSKFEAFVASYFDETFPSPFVFVMENPDAQGNPGFMAATKARGDWQIFPRDPGVLPLLNDGRWKIEPYPLNWAVMPYLQATIGLRRNTTAGLTAVLMAPTTECFAMATPYEGESHYSLYPSLFGRDIKAGETATAHTRLVVAKDVSDEKALEFYKQYMMDILPPRGATRR